MLNEVEAGETSCFKARYDKEEARRQSAAERDIYVWE